MSVFEPLKPFRFWCQKVLPLVYDDTLSYYELLCKVVDYLNNTMQDVNTLGDAFQELQTYVNDYFTSLDVQEEINNKLDEMVTDGTLVTILLPTVADEVADWLSEHITPTTPSIDNTLTVSGAGADAKVTGDMRTGVIHTVGEINLINGVSFTDGYMINDNGELVDIGSGYAYSDLIDVDNDFYTLYWRLTQNSSIVQIHGYDSTGTWIKSLKKDSRNVVGDYAESFNCIGIEKIRISIRLLYVENLYLNRKQNLTEYADNIRKNAFALSSFYNQAIESEKEIADISEIEEVTGAIVVNGDFGYDTTESSSYSATSLIPINPGMYLRNSTPVGSGSHKINFYDSDGVNIQSLDNIYNNTLVVAPDHSAFVRFDFLAENGVKAFVCSKESDASILEKGTIKANIFGYMAEWGVNSNGNAVNMPGGSICLTNYLPVRPGSKIIIPYNLGSSYWHLAIYKEDKTVISTIPMNQDLSESIIDIPENAMFIRMSIDAADINNVYYLYFPKNVSVDNINVTRFGAVGDGITDNSAVLQRCFNLGGAYNIPIFIPEGEYLITQQIKVNYQNTAIYGVPWGEYEGSRIIVKAFRQTVESDTVTYPKNEDGSQVNESTVPNSALLIKRAGVIIKDLVFTLNNETTLQSDLNNLVVDGIHFILGRQDNANIDGEINRCVFVGLNNGVLLEGRNLKINECLFTHSNVGVKMNWEQRFSYEQRGVIISENRFHSIGRNKYGITYAYDRSKGCIKFPDYVSPDYIRLNVIRNNYADYCGDFFSGDAHGVEIKNNSIYLSRGALVNTVAKSISVSNGTTLNFSTLFPEGLPATQSGVYIWTLTVINRSGLYLTPLIPVTGGGAVKLNFSFATNVWGHGFYNSRGEMIDAVIANKEGTFIIPDDAAYMRFTAEEENIENITVTLYDSYTTETAASIDPSYAEQQITICDNTICGAIKTDYTSGLNVMENSIYLKGYSGVVIKDNIFTNGISDVIEIDLCEKITINGNAFNSSPRYCEVFDDEGINTVYEATNKNLIKMTDTDDYKIIYNSAINGLKYDGSDQSYVSVPVTLDGNAVDVSSKNDF